MVIRLMSLQNYQLYFLHQRFIQQLPLRRKLSIRKVFNSVSFANNPLVKNSKKCFETSRYSNSYLTIKIALISPIKVSIISFLFAQNYDNRNLPIFPLCRKTDAGKNLKNVALKYSHISTTEFKIIHHHLFRSFWNGLSEQLFTRGKQFTIQKILFLGNRSENKTKLFQKTLTKNSEALLHSFRFHPKQF